MKEHLVTILLIVAIIAAAVFFITRSLYRSSPDDLQQRIDSLYAQLDRSEALRDSLDGAIALREDSLVVLRLGEQRLLASLQSLEEEASRQGRVIIDQRKNLTRYEQSNDTLLAELNDILRRDILPAQRTGATAARH